MCGSDVYHERCGYLENMKTTDRSNPNPNQEESRERNYTHKRDYAEE